MEGRNLELGRGSPCRDSGKQQNKLSSILKQPKFRAPFRELDLNPSTDDEGTTTNVTRTRRVSFSVTQIKEFHSNADVETFWGSTYEKKFQQTDSSSNSECESSSFSLRGVSTTICTGADTPGLPTGRQRDDQSLEPVEISSWRHDHQRQITQESSHLKPSDLPSCDKALSHKLLKETQTQAFECHNNSDSLLSFASVQKESDFTRDFMKKVGRQSPDKPFSPVFKFDINSSKKPMCRDVSFGSPGNKCSYIEIPKNILHGFHPKELNFFSKLIVTDTLVSNDNRPVSDSSNIKSEKAQHLSYSIDKARMHDRNEQSHHNQSRIRLNISCSSSMDSGSMNEDDSVFLNQSSSSEEINPTTLTQNTNPVGFLSVPVKYDDTNVKNSTYYNQDFTGSTMGRVKILGGNQSTSRFQETSVNLDKTQASLSGEKSNEIGTEYTDKLMDNCMSHVNKSCHTNLDLTNTLKSIKGSIPSINESVNSDMDCTEPLGGIIGGISNRREILAKSNIECTKTGGGINCGMPHLNESVTSDMEYTEPLEDINIITSNPNESTDSDMDYTKHLGGIHYKMSQLNESVKSDMDFTEPLGGIHNKLSQLNKSAKSDMECTEPLGGIHNRMSQLNESTKSNMECTEPLGGIHNRMSQLNESAKSNMECTEPLGGIHNRMSQLNESTKSNMECTEPLGGIHNIISQLNESTKSNMECTEPLGGIHNRMSQLNEATVNSDIECIKTLEGNYPSMSQLNKVSIISDMECTKVLGGVHDRMSQLNETPTNSDKECIGTLGAIESRTETYIISNVDPTTSANCISSRTLDLNETSVNSDRRYLKVSSDIKSTNLNFKDNLTSNMNSSKPQEDVGYVSPVVSNNESDKHCLDSTQMCSLSASVDIKPQPAHSFRFDVIKADELVGKTKTSSQTSLCDIKKSFGHSLEVINNEELAQINQAVFDSPCNDSNMEISRTVVPAIKDCVLLINQPFVQCELTNPSLLSSVSYKSCKNLSKAMVPLEDTEQSTKIIDTQIFSQKGISFQSPTNETFKKIPSRSISNQGFVELANHPQREANTKLIHLADLYNSSLNKLHSEENNSRTFPESVMELSEPVRQGNEEASMKSNDLCDISCSQSDNKTTIRSCHGINLECTKVIPSLDDSSKEIFISSLNKGVFCVQSQKPKSALTEGPQTSELIFEVNNHNKTIVLDSQSKTEISHPVNTFLSVSDHDQHILLNQSSLSAKHDTTRFGKGNQSYLCTHGTNVEQTTKPIIEIPLVKRCVVSSDKGNQVTSAVAEDKIDEKSNQPLTIQELHHKERTPTSLTHDLAPDKLTSHKSVSETGNNDKSPLPLRHSLIDESHEHTSLNTKIENSGVLDLSHLPPKKRAYEISAQLSESNLEVDLIPCKRQCIPTEIHKPTSLLEDVSSNEMCLNATCGATQCNQGKHMPHKNTSPSEKSVSFVNISNTNEFSQFPIKDQKWKSISGNSSYTTCDTSMLLCQPASPCNSLDNLSKDMTSKQDYEGVTNIVEYLHTLPENCSKILNKNINIVDKITGEAGNTNVSFHPDIKRLNSFDSSNKLLQPNREIPSEPRNMVNTLPNISSNEFTALFENSFSFISTDSSSMLPKDQNLDKYDEYILRSTILNDSRNVRMFSASPDEILYQKDTQQCDVTTSLKIDTSTDFIDNNIDKETQSRTTKTSADAVQGTLEKELSHSIESKASGMSLYDKENNMVHSPDLYKNNSDVKLTDEVDKSQEVCLLSDQYTKYATIVSSLSSVAVNDQDASRILQFQHQALSDSDVPKTVAFETQSRTTKTSADAVQGTLEKELSLSIESKASGMSLSGKENNMVHSPDLYKDNSDVKLTDEVDKSQEVCLRSDQYTKHATIVSSLSSVAVNDRDASRILQFQHQALSDSDVPKTVAFETTDCGSMTSSLIKLSYALCSDGLTPKQGESASKFSVMPPPKRDTPITDDLANLNKSMAHMAAESPITKAPSKMLSTVEEVIQEKYSNESSPMEIKAMNDLEWAFTFLYDSLELVIKLETNKNPIYKSVTAVCLHSRVTEKTDSMGRWAHHVLLAKWSNGYLKSRCKTTQQIPKLLDDFSAAITQLAEFIMEYECIRAKELVRMADNKISFDMSSMEPLLWFRVTVDLSHWEIVLPSDISIQDIVGHVRTQDVQNLVSGVDKGPQFLRHYIRDINEYLNILYLYHQ